MKQIDARTDATVPYFLQGGGEMGAHMRAFDWRQTPLGPPEQWPGCLRTAVNIVLGAQFPMFLFWGEDAICIYNDAYRPSLGDDGRHPSILGQPGRTVWQDSWNIFGAQLEKVMDEGVSLYFEDQLVPVYRNGGMEQAYWTYSYNPVLDESGRPAGVFVACTETTQKLENEKKLAQSLQLFRSILEQAPDPMLILKGEDMILEVANGPLTGSGAWMKAPSASLFWRSCRK